MSILKITKNKPQYIIHFFGIKIAYTPKKIFSAYSDTGINNKIIVIKNGKENILKSWERIPDLKIKFLGSNNVVRIGENCNFKEATIFMRGDNNEVVIADDCSGQWRITCYSDNNKVSIGKHSSASSVWVTLINSELQIGQECIFSNNINIWSDGHSVLDYKTREVLNLPKKPIVIGNHVCLGDRVTVCKNACIPNDSIVGVAAVVTKSFDEEHTLIAGNPAVVKKRGITWDGREPLTYYNDMHPKN